MKDVFFKKATVFCIIFLLFSVSILQCVIAVNNEMTNTKTHLKDTCFEKKSLDAIQFDVDVSKVISRSRTVFRKIFSEQFESDTLEDRSDDAFQPTIIINFAGNVSDSGGPYWRPPGEDDRLDEAEEGDWQHGYYTNDSRQHEDWIYINLTVTDDDEVEEVWLHWFDQTINLWDNISYRFRNTVGDYWEFNSSGNISDIVTDHNYSFDILAEDSLGNTNLLRWEKIGLGGCTTRRFVQLDCSPEDITYRPFYLRSYTKKTGIYERNDCGTADRLHHDQGPDGTLTDSGYLSSTLPGEIVEDRYCYTYTAYGFDESICIQPFTLTNIYFHYWYASRTDDLDCAGWGKSRDRIWLNTLDDYNPSDSNGSRSSVSYNTNDRKCYLDTCLLQTTPTAFTDNDIYELYLLFSEDPLREKDTRGDHTVCIKTLSNRSFLSFILFNVPENNTLIHLDTDSDELSDWVELFKTFTSPFLSDTDSDGASDYEEVNGENYGFWNSDPNSYTNTTDFRKSLYTDAGGPYYGFFNRPIQFRSSTLGGRMPYQWHWDFGDGQNSTLQNPVHSYSEIGCFTVNLTVIDNNGNMCNDTSTVFNQVPMVWVDDDFNTSTQGWGITHFNTIQGGINNGPRNGKVIVNNGYYNERIRIEKPLQLIGRNRDSTIIDGENRSPVISILADNVTISGFTIKNNYFSWINLGSGIWIDSDHNTISDNLILDCGEGIGLAMDASFNTIFKNKISSLIGIWLHGCHIEGPNSNIIFRNLFIDNYIGIHQHYLTSNTEITNNLVINTKQESEYGIALFGSSNSTISGNIIKGYYVGTGIGYSWSWYIPSYNNIIYHNFLQNNIINGYDECINKWYNVDMQEGNYWDDYTGVDENNDGIGDTPYAIYGGNNQDLYPLMNLYQQMLLMTLDSYSPVQNLIPRLRTFSENP